MGEIGFDQIRKMLPQRPPFMLIDKVLEYEPDESLIAFKNITGTEFFSSVHFEECAIYPGVYLIEMSAQASLLLLMLSENQRDEKKLGLLGNVSQFQFLNTVVPGDSLKIKVSLVKKIEGMAITKVEIFCEERQVARGQLSFGVKKYEQVCK